jgi:hypothetical protein
VVLRCTRTHERLTYRRMPALTTDSAQTGTRLSTGKPGSVPIPSGRSFCGSRLPGDTRAIAFLTPSPVPGRAFRGRTPQSDQQAVAAHASTRQIVLMGSESSLPSSSRSLWECKEDNSDEPSVFVEADVMAFGGAVEVDCGRRVADGQGRRRRGAGQTPEPAGRLELPTPSLQGSARGLPPVVQSCRVACPGGHLGAWGRRVTIGLGNLGCPSAAHSQHSEWSLPRRRAQVGLRAEPTRWTL